MRRRRSKLIGVVLASALLLAPVSALAGGSEEPDGRARPSWVEGIVDDDGQLWLKIGFYNPWGDEPPQEIFSLFWLMGIITDDASSSVGWETHDGVETYLGDDGTEAYILDNGCVLISTGLYPTGEYEVSIVVEFASWLIESDPVLSGSTSFGLSSEFIDPGNPFLDFGGSPIWSLTIGAVVGGTTAPSSTTTSSSTTTTQAGSTTDDTTGTGSGSSDSGSTSDAGFPWWLIVLGGLVALLIWMYLNGKLNLGAAPDDAGDATRTEPSDPKTFSVEDRELLQEIYRGADDAGYKIAGISSIKDIEEVTAGSKDHPVVIGTAATLTIRVAEDGSLIPRRGDTGQSATSILEIDVRPGVEFDSDGTSHVVWNAHVQQIDVETGRIVGTSKAGPSGEEWSEKVDGRSDAEIGNDPDFKDWVVDSMPSTAAEAVQQALGAWSPAGP